MISPDPVAVPEIIDVRVALFKHGGTLANQMQQPLANRGNHPATASYQAFRTAMVQAAFLVPHLRPGMSLLDCGSGLGNITVGLAELVAPGEVVGIDIDSDRVEQATTLAEERGVTNVSFRTADVLTLPFPDTFFDAAFEHAVFEHVKDPLQAAREVFRVLKSGAVFGARDSENDAWFHGGPAEGVEWDELRDYRSFISRWGASRGSNYFFGKHLPSVLRKAGFVSVGVSASFDVVTELPISRPRGFLEDPDAVAYARSEGINAEVVFPRWLKAIEEWIAHPDAFGANGKVEAIGWKP